MHMPESRSSGAIRSDGEAAEVEQSVVAGWRQWISGILQCRVFHVPGTENQHDNTHRTVLLRPTSPGVFGRTGPHLYMSIAWPVSNAREACLGRKRDFIGTMLVIDGRSTPFMRVGDSGDTITFHFCPLCGSTVYWQIGSASDLIAVAVGSFADAHFPEPRHSVYERRRHAWVSIQENAYMEHLD